MLLFLFAGLTLSSFADVRLPRLIRDSMILQRDMRVRCWGWADPGERVSVRINGKKLQAVAAADSSWMIELSPMKAGGPYTITIDGHNHIVLHDVLVGDVWVCSGQSNMVHQMGLHSDRYGADIRDAHYPEIREFWIPTMADLDRAHRDLPAGYWKSADPQQVRDFSAIAYFFARDLFEKYHVPIGLINASVGGTPIQAWISEEGLRGFPELSATIGKNRDTAYVNSLRRRLMSDGGGRVSDGGGGVSDGGSGVVPADKGLAARPAWYEEGYKPIHWRPITIPGYWEDQGAAGLHGIVWYRKEIEIPASMSGKPAKLVLGRIVDADVVYINGKEVGHTTYMYPQRRYVLPEGILRAGVNLIVVRVMNQGGKGGFVPDKPYCLVVGQDTLDLKGTWSYKVGEAVAPRGPGGGGGGFSAQNSPTALYNAMLAPATFYSVKGVLWYQGEANTGDAASYSRLMPALIRDWRVKWREGDIPFLYVQLPGFGDVRYFPMESQWAATREAQSKALALPATDMAVAIDLGEWNDIHPDRKKDVGDRLALLAERLAYGEKGIVASGPRFQSANVEGNRIVVSFTGTGGGLMTNDGEEPGEFAIAGADKKFVWARARIEGDKVVVWNEGVAAPLYVRYGWADNPDNPNLFNKEGLPAAPFRTDGDKPLEDGKGLKDYYSAYFPIGVAVSPRALKTDEASLVLQQYNSLTPENAMKMGPIHPTEKEYFWSDADSIVAFAVRNHLRVRGHNLCWHNQAPRWFFTDSAGKTVSKAVLLQRLKEHITTVVNRYKGKIYAWDVVNEVISDKADEYFRPSKFYEICGEEFVARAFQYAHEADPNALLFYNDYNEINPVKREKIYRLVKSLRETGIPIGGLGMQAHWAINEPSRERLDSTLQYFSTLGVALQITELDISVYAKEHEARGRRAADADTVFTEERRKQQEEKYKMCFELFRKYKQAISGVTFWNISDRYSWLDNFPVRGRKDYPLLFDKGLKPKKSFYEVVSF